MSEKKQILFVCVENAGRSQMAEAFFNKFSPENYQAASAGTQPAPKVNPLVVQAMKEVGIDLSNNKPKVLSDKVINQSTKTINMGCMNKEACPALFNDNMIEWQIPDPSGKSLEEVRVIRDQIHFNIKELVSTLH